METIFKMYFFSLISQFQHTVLALKTLPGLKSLFINLHQEEQVDFIMRTLDELEFLNGLKVERDILDEENYEEEPEGNKEHSPVREEPIEEDLEEEEHHNKYKRDKIQQPEPIEEVNETAQESPSQSFHQQEAENSIQAIEAQRESIINISPEDLEGIATLYDRIRQIRRVSTKVRNNNDKKLAQDFDTHLKKTLSNLENEVKYHNKDVSILKAKRSMVEILVQKFCEYLKQIDNRETADITSEISKHYYQLIDQGIFSIKQHQVQGASDNEAKALLNQKEEQIQSMTQQIEEMTQTNQKLQTQLDQQKKKSQKDVDEQKKKLRELETENRSLRLKVQAMQNQASKVTKQESVSTDNIENSKMSSNQPKSVRTKKSDNDNQNLLKTSASQPKKKFTGPIGPTQSRVLTLKQLKETIDDIYVQKVKFDKKCEENKLPRETMEQYMYTYLNQKYGLKNLIIEWAASIINGIKTYLKDDHDVALFGKILKNECDEEFRYIQMHVKETLTNLLKVLVKEKNPFKPEVEIGKMLDKIQNSTIDEWMWKKIIEKMYDPKDFEILESRFLLLIEEKKIQNRGSKPNFQSKYLMDTQQSTNTLQGKKMSREEMMHLMHNKEQEKLTYHDFQKIILDFQLQEHEKFLFKFTQIFKQVDRDNNGVVNEDEFREMVDRLNILDREEEVMYLLQMVDPYNNQRMTYSEIVHLLSSHMVPVDYSNPSHTIPLLEKFVNKYGNGEGDFQDETEIRRQSDEQDNELVHYQQNDNYPNQEGNYESQSNNVYSNQDPGFPPQYQVQPDGTLGVPLEGEQY